MNFIVSLFKVVIGLIVLLIAVFALTLFAARFADGPWAIITGGSFSSGKLVTEEPDWAFVKEHGEVEFELVASGTSRTTWIAEHEGRIFIPSGYMNSTLGKIWKQWPAQAVEDGRAILRVDDKLYQRQMVRIHEDPALPHVLSEITRKYFPQAPQPMPMSEVTSNNTWVFELVRP